MTNVTVSLLIRVCQFVQVTQSAALNDKGVRHGAVVKGQPREFVLRVILRFVLRFAPTSFCTAFCASFCTSHRILEMPRIPLCEADSGDRAMLTTYSPHLCQRVDAQHRLHTSPI